MRILPSEKLYLPAFSIVATVLILLIFIGISTYRNMNQNKKRAMYFIHRQGVVMLRSLEAGARSGILLPGWHRDSIRNLIRETGKDEDIAYIYMFNPQGIIIDQSDFSEKNMSIDWIPRLENAKQIKSRIRNISTGHQVYELAKRFQPLGRKPPRHKQMGRRHRFHELYADTTIVLGLKMDMYEAAQKKDLYHAIVMGAILMVMGSGTLFFIFVIQNYYLTHRTLKETRDYTRQVLASMANGLLSIDPKGNVVSYNLLGLELLNLKESEVRGTNLKKIFDFHTTGIFQTLNTCRPVLDQEIRYPLNSGGNIPLSLSVTPISDENGTCSGAVIVLRDLREIKRLEEKVRRSEKLAAVGKLAASVAHEIRNPLSSIRGFAQFLQHVLKDRPKDQEYAEIMVREIDRINRVVTDLLTFARPLEAEQVPTSVTEMIHHTIRLVQADARARQIEIRQHMDSDLPDLFLDGNQMTQAFLNLMLNALQATDTGGIIEVGAGLSQGTEILENTFFYLWVEDNGPGISPEHQEKIFDPFFTTRQKGTGLGLAIVHKIAENHQGDIQVRSPAPGKKQGCRFTIRIPVNQIPKDTELSV